MIITEKQRGDMLEVAKPLMKWMAENTNSNFMAIVQAAHIELLEGITTNTNVEFVEDGIIRTSSKP